ncbi:hypothetical protein PV326_012231 [Microctonus aethiopoides]|nr:hypothetical protein PV326_012231 [Microctonus aethiopoides]
MTASLYSHYTVQLAQQKEIKLNNKVKNVAVVNTHLGKNTTKLYQKRNNSNYESYPKLTGSFVEENNIYKSFLPDIEEKKMYLHEHVWENIDKWSDKTAVVCSITGRSYNYGQLRRLCGRLATSLRKSNLRPGDTIAIIAPNIPEYAIVVMGASEAGLKLTLINPIYTVEEIKKQLANSKTAAVITVPDKYPIVAKSILEIPTIRLPIIIINDGSSMPSSNVIHFNELVSDDIEEFENTGEKTERSVDCDTLFLPYSSGTTGLPKGVELTHRNVVVNILQQNVKELITESAIGIDQEIVPIFLPLYHIYGLIVGLCNHLGRGDKLICMPQFSSNALLEVLEKNRTTLFYAAPPVYQLIINDERFKKRHMESVKLTMSGAAPIGSEVLSKFFARIQIEMAFLQGYGMTETSPVVSKSKGAPLETVGYLVPNCHVRIVGCNDNNMGKNLGLNEVGEIFVRGPHVMKGYYNNQKATADCFEDDWLKTGDLGSFDKNGFLHINGRLKELIKVQGHQVSPAELEDIIQGHENVADAAVIGVPHERYGEVPKAFVVAKPNVKINEQEIKDFVAKQVAKYKQLGKVVFIDVIPKSQAGKILRKDLQKMQ